MISLSDVPMDPDDWSSGLMDEQNGKSVYAVRVPEAVDKSGFIRVRAKSSGTDKSGNLFFFSGRGQLVVAFSAGNWIASALVVNGNASAFESIPFFGDEPLFTKVSYERL